MKHLSLMSLFVLAILAAAPLARAAAAPAAANPLGVFDVRAYGAVGDGKTLDTQALQAAIDACTAAGGGRVVLAGGTFLSGTIVLRSGVALYLEAGATLLGSTNLDDFPSHIPAMRSYTDNYTEKSLIYAEKQEGIAILGLGTIDGQGGAAPYQKKPYKLRPYMIRVIECRDVTVRDVTIRNSPMWVQHYLGCTGVLIDGITVNSRVNANNDGIDIDCSEQVRIANCNIISGDDAIVIKSNADRLCRQVTVTNCVLSSHCNAIKTGTESNGGFQDITISNCVIHDTRLSGIALELVDGGAFDRVCISGITMDKVSNPFFIRLANRARPFKEGQDAIPMGTMKNLMIRDVQATGAGVVGCSVTGLPGHPIENVTLENIRITSVGGGPAEAITREIPEKETAYPEYKIFGTLPSYGFYVRHARNVRFRGIDLDFAKPDPRPALVFDDVQDLDLSDIKAQVDPAAPARFWFKNVADALIRDCRPAASPVPLLQLDGTQTERIRLWHNDLTQLKDPVRLGEGVNKEAMDVRN